MSRVRTEYEVWQDELAADQRRNTTLWALLELLKITAVYGVLLGVPLFLSHIF
jgi:hypothetical protein